MKISLNWLKDYVTPGVSTQELAHRLTMAGLEVEKIHSVGTDKVFELEITPNRADCLNMIGISREVSAILNKARREPTIKKVKYPTKKCDIEIKDKEACQQYVGTLIENVKMGESPAWIKKRIESLGIRPISNVVDVTNFCLMEMGQPLHAFDYDKLAGGKIIVRRAKKGETITTLDGVERTLDPSILVIADAKKAVAIAGIMGGADTEVTKDTKNILLESAYFDPILTRRASRKLGLSSDSAYRFERGVDYFNVANVSNRAVNLLLDLTKGSVVRYAKVVAKGKTEKRKPITISLEKINTYLGAKLTAAKCKTILNKLQFKVVAKGTKSFSVTAPTFRSDISSEVDLVEEISRVIGYDNLPSSIPQVKLSSIPASSRRAFKKKLQSNMMAQGFNEIITYSLINQPMIDKSNLSDVKCIKIQNPLTKDQEIMRPSMLPSLLSIIQFNLNRGQKDLSLFEFGKVYTSQGEKDVLAIIMTGTRMSDWRASNKTVDYFDIKGSVEQALDRVQIKNLNFENTKLSYLAEEQSAALSNGKTEVGIIGKVSSDVLNKWDIKDKNIFFAQIDLEGLDKHVFETKEFQPITEYPAIVRDMSLAVKKDIQFQQIKNTALELGSDLLTSVEFIEEYLGDKIPKDCRGIVFSLVYQSTERTLTEDEVNKIQKDINQALLDKLGVIIR